jgi:hypothetical protein
MCCFLKKSLVGKKVERSAQEQFESNIDLWSDEILLQIMLMTFDPFCKIDHESLVKRTTPVWIRTIPTPIFNKQFQHT